MSFPYYITLGPNRFLLHNVMEAMAFFVGFRYFVYLRKKTGDPIGSSNRTSILIGAIFGALLGSRLIGGLENPALLAKTHDQLLYFYANKTVLGGLLGGLFGVEAIKKCIGEKKPSGDLFVYPLILALIIGRIGCFSMGIHEETYGIPSSLPWALDLGDGIPRHPVTLYEIAFLLPGWIALARLDKKSPRPQPPAPPPPPPLTDAAAPSPRPALPSSHAFLAAPSTPALPPTSAPALPGPDNAAPAPPSTPYTIPPPASESIPHLSPDSSNAPPSPSRSRTVPHAATLSASASQPIHYTLAPGARFKIFLILYLFFRLLLDFIKPHYTFNIGLSTIQLTCIAGLAYYYRYLLHPRKLLSPGLPKTNIP